MADSVRPPYFAGTSPKRKAKTESLLRPAGFNWQFQAAQPKMAWTLDVTRAETIAMRRISLLLFFVLAGLAASMSSPTRTAPAQVPEVQANTFSIVAFDPESKSWGVATASRVLAVGAAVPYAKADTGAVASQALVNVTYGPRALELLAAGKSAEETLQAITATDKGKEHRQVGIVDAKGNVAHFTGKECSRWAGAKAGKHFVCLGNLLTGQAVVDDMAKAFEEAKGPLAWRLMAALEAGDKAGGDRRGKQSAAILVARARGGPNGFGDRTVDLRVDDHEQPVQELARILAKRIRRPEK
jgi:uncharacterized Ntn-hydrolase superfamily protein